MPGYKSGDLRHSCALNGCIIDTLPDLSWLNECYFKGTGRGILGSDLDHSVEVGGRCLFVEHKGRNGAISNGQRGMLKKLAAQGNSVMVLRETDDPDMFEVLVYSANDSTGYQLLTRADVQDWVVRWCRFAEAHPLPPREDAWPADADQLLTLRHGTGKTEAFIDLGLRALSPR